jgi:hypothetical protein
MQKDIHRYLDLGKILRRVFHFSCCIYRKSWIGTGTGLRVLVQPVNDLPVVIACCGLARQVRCWFLHSSFIHSFIHSLIHSSFILAVLCVPRSIYNYFTLVSFHTVQEACQLNCCLSQSMVQLIKSVVMLHSQYNLFHDRVFTLRS